MLATLGMAAGMILQCRLRTAFFACKSSVNKGKYPRPAQATDCCTVVLGVITRYLYQSQQFAGRQEAVVLSLLYELFLLAPISNANQIEMKKVLKYRQYDL